MIIAFFVSFIMYTWREGRLLLQQKVKGDILPFDSLQHRIHENSITRYNGVSIFLSSDSEGILFLFIYLFCFL